MGYVLVVGDVMLDRRTEGEMSHISREAPAPIIRKNQQTDGLGGAGNVVRNVRALGAWWTFRVARGSMRPCFRPGVCRWKVPTSIHR